MYRDFYKQVMSTQLFAVFVDHFWNPLQRSTYSAFFSDAFDEVHQSSSFTPCISPLGVGNLKELPVVPNLEERGIMFQDTKLSRQLNLTVCVWE